MPRPDCKDARIILISPPHGKGHEDKARK